MFNNPNFQTDIITQSKTSSTSQRSSVQQVLDKYETRNSAAQGQRFTFQTANGSNEDRQTFGNLQGQQFQNQIVPKVSNDQPRDSNLQFLASIDESNLSKVLSEFSIISEAQDNSLFMHNQYFSNPLDIKSQLVLPVIMSPRGQQQKHIERVTFGEQYAQNFFVVQQIQPNPLPVYLGNDETQRSCLAEDQIFDDMSMLRDKVLGLLQTYSGDIRDSKSLKNVKQKVQNDAKQIAKEYSQIVDKVNQTDISAFTNISFESQLPNNPKKEQELNLMFNLVEEFLDKFEPGKQQTNYSQLIEKKLATSRIAPQRSPNDHQNNITSDTVQRQSDQMDLSVLPSFPAISPDDTFYLHQNIPVDKLKNKLSKLRSLLLQELDHTNLPYTRNILSDMINNLNDILTANDTQTVKTVVYKIEQGIKDLKLEDQASVKLYNYMAKAIKVTNKRLVQVTQNEPKQEENKTLKRKFFDSALKIKNQLPREHASKQIMVSLLYDEFIQCNLADSQIEAFIRQKLQI